MKVVHLTVILCYNKFEYGVLHDLGAGHCSIILKILMFQLINYQLSFEYIVRNKVIWIDLESPKIFSSDISYTRNLFTKGYLCRQLSRTSFSHEIFLKDFNFFLKN